MKEVLHFLLKQLVDHPEDIAISEEEQNDKLVLTIRVHQDDMGKVIGKHGRIIRAVRDLVKLVATKHKSFVDIVIAENGQ